MIGECRMDVGMINAIIKSVIRDESRLVKRFYRAIVVTKLVKLSIAVVLGSRRLSFNSIEPHIIGFDLIVNLGRIPIRVGGKDNMR